MDMKIRLPLRALIVEDSDDDAVLLLDLLAEGGYEVTHRRVETAEAMREALKAQTWDIVISDHRMPRFDALAALKLRGLLAPELPFIVVSGGIGEEAAVEAMRSGAADYVMKDSLARLVPAVRRELQDANARRGRRRAEAALSQSESLNKVILASSLDCIVIVDHLGRFVDFNPAAETTFGYRREDVVGQSMRDLIIPPRWRAEHDQRFSRFLATGVGHMIGTRMELEALRADGTEFPIELGIAVVRHGPEPLFAGFIRDLSERRRAEESLRRFRVAMDHSADMFLLIDRRTMRYIDFNATVPRLLGYSRQELLAMGPQDIMPVSRAELEASYDKLIANQGTRGDIESYYICKDGTHLPFESTRHVLRAGENWVIAALARDITERRANQTRIRHLNRVYAVLSGINAAIVRLHEKEDLYREACRIAVAAGGFSVARIVELDAGGRARVAASIEEDPTLFQQIVDNYNADPAGADSLLAQALRGGNAMVSNDVASDERIGVRTQLSSPGSYSLALLPLVVGGRKAGVIVLRAQETGMFDAEEMKLLTELAGDISFALDHIEKEKRLDYLALYDSLTGLANARCSSSA